MKCAKCRKTITGLEAKKAVLEKTPEGKLKAAYHKKCAHVIKRRAQLDADDRSSAPTAYEMAATRQNADDITEQARLKREKAEQELARLKELAQSRAASQVVVTDIDEDGAISLDEMIHSKEQEVALAARQVEIAEQAKLEERPEQWNDHREPIETEI